ncbi:hypothetical protein D9619_000151 [Psilocybe cf. subviscida]|uniref:TPR-like protein n=1 Tax=Psilocybe cf. subviscida TaxID=2480587 RepID=A0A8H5BD36_9AGAR|nr:hypothetical protein D9619_000151 [Psilocybe cf. subviscida]
MSAPTNTYITLVEKSLLRGAWDSAIPADAEAQSPAVHLAKSVVECRYKNVLQSDAARKLFRTAADLKAAGNRQTDSAKEEDRQWKFADLLDVDFATNVDHDVDRLEEELARLGIAIACLHAFVQVNWTGPDLDIEPAQLFTSRSADSKSDAPTTSSTNETNSKYDAEELQARATTELAEGGEPAYHLATSSAFLRLSQLILSDSPFSKLSSIQWWRLRAETIHQQILDEPAPPADDDATKNFRALLEPLLTSFATEKEDADLRGMLHLELGLWEHVLEQDRRAGEDFLRAAKETGMQFELTGALGKRTKFQETELSQLVLLAESHLPDPEDLKSKGEDGKMGDASEASSAPIVPETLALNDDTLLEKTEFTSTSSASSGPQLSHINPSNQPPLHPLDQCILLSLCLNVRNTQPAHGLTGEQMAPYVARVLSHPRNWSVHTMALLLRARLEAHRTRTVERSTFQLQALIEQMPTTADAAPAERLRYVHGMPLPSRWEMEKELARRYMSLGVVKSALEIFTRREMWADAVGCYGALEQKEKGISLVRDLLEGRKREADEVLASGKAVSEPRRSKQDAAHEAKLWCLLGDLESAHSEEHYRKAWDVSGNTSGRAMRSLGGLYFAKAQYEQAVECLQNAVRINPLLTRSWFILGCANMRLEKWEEAKVAFSRCVAIDEEDGESWNNLASMYLRTGATKKSTPADDDEDDEETASKDVEIANGELSPSVPFENKMLAFRALKHGLRFAYENWRMWINYMIVAMDVGELSEACRALGRAVDQTQGKVDGVIDEDVVDRLVNAVTRAHRDPQQAAAESAEASAAAGGDGEPVHNPNEGHGLHRNVLHLLEKTLLPRVSSRPRLFRAYARLLAWRGQWADAVKANMDAYRCGVASTIEKGDEVSVAVFNEAVDEVEETVDMLRNFGELAAEDAAAKGEDGREWGGGKKDKWRLQARTIIRAFMGRTRDFEEREEYSAGWQRLEEMLAEANKKEED